MEGGLSARAIGTSAAYAAPSIVAAIACFVAGVYLLDRTRSARALRSYAIALIAESVWSACIVAELTSPTLASKLLWDGLQLPALFVTAIALFDFTLDYTGRSLARPARSLALLGLLPALTTLYVLGDPLHHRARVGAELVPGAPFASLVYPFTTLEIGAFGYALALVVASVALLARELARQPRAFRAQTALVLVGAATPIVPAFFLVAGIPVLGQRDASPIVFGTSALLTVWGLRRRGLFELVPVARDAVLERIPDAIFVVDADDRVVDANPSARRFVPGGREPLHRPLHDVLPEVADAISRLDDPHATFEVRVECEGGSCVVAVRLGPLADHRGRDIGRVIVMTDVSARVAAEEEARIARSELEERVAERTAELARANEALRRENEDRRAAEVALSESEQRFRAVFDQTFQLIGVLTLDGVVVRTNHTALAFAGVDASQVDGLPFWDTPFWTHSPELQEKLRSAVAQAARGELVRFEATHPAADGAEHVIDFSIKPIVGPDGKPVLLVPEGRDVTEQKRAQLERAQLEVQLHQAQKMESLGRLAGGVAHDFNNLLTAILGNASLIQRKVDESLPVAMLAREIVRAGESAAELTRQLLAFSRKQVIDRRVEDLGVLVERLVKLLERVVGADVEIVTDVRARSARARIDAGQIEQAILNLAVNARDAMPRGGRLVLTVDTRPLGVEERARAGFDEGVDEAVSVEVTDTGTGMPPEVRARIFEPFFTTKPVGRGTGLGLAMVFGALRQNGGVVEVVSEVGVGTTFRLLFPRTREASERIVARERGLGVPQGHERLVLVEDQALVRELATRWLEELGYAVRAFASAEEALASIAASDPIDLLLTDVVLSGMSGRLLAERLALEHRTMRVLFMSGYNDDVVLDQPGNGVHARILSKPFTVERLAIAVRHAIEPRSGEFRLDEEPFVRAPEGREETPA